MTSKIIETTESRIESIVCVLMSSFDHIMSCVVFGGGSCTLLITGQGRPPTDKWYVCVCVLITCIILHYNMYYFHFTLQELS